MLPMRSKGVCPLSFRDTIEDFNKQGIKAAHTAFSNRRFESALPWLKSSCWPFLFLFLFFKGHRKGDDTKKTVRQT